MRIILKIVIVIILGSLVGGGVFEACREAVARKVGSDGVAPTSDNFESGGSNGQSTGTTADLLELTGG